MIIGYTIVQFKYSNPDKPEEREMSIIKSFGPEELETAKEVLEFIKKDRHFPKEWNGIYYSYNLIRTEMAESEADMYLKKDWFTLDDLNNGEE